MATFTKGKSNDSEREYSKADMEKILKTITKTLSTQTDTLEKYQKFQEKYAKTKNQEIIALIENQSKELKQLEEKYSGRMTGGKAIKKGSGMLGDMLLAGNPFGQLIQQGRSLFNDVYPKADREANKKDRELKKLGAKQEKERNLAELKEDIRKKNRRKERDAENKTKSGLSKKEKSELKKKHKDPATANAAMDFEAMASGKSTGNKKGKLEKAQEQTLKITEKSAKENSAKNKADAKDKKEEKKKGKVGQFLKDAGKGALIGLLPILILLLPAIIAAIKGLWDKIWGIDPEQEKKANEGRVNAENKRRAKSGQALLNETETANMMNSKKANGEDVGIFGPEAVEQGKQRQIVKINNELDSLNEDTMNADEADLVTGDGYGTWIVRSHRAIAGYKQKNPKNKANTATKKLSGGTGTEFVAHEGEYVKRETEMRVTAKKNMFSPESNVALTRLKQKDNAQLRELQTINKNTVTNNNTATSNTTTAKADTGKKEVQVRDYSPVSEVLKAIYVFGGGMFS